MAEPLSLRATKRGLTKAGGWTVRLAIWGLVLASCSSGASQEDLDRAVGNLDAANEEIALLESNVGELDSALDSASGERDAALGNVARLEDDLELSLEELSALETQITELEQARDDAAAEAAGVEAELEELTLAYDPEIQAAAAALSGQALELACSEARDAGLSGASSPPSVSSVMAKLDASAVGFEAADLVDSAEVQSRLNDCFETAAGEAAAEALQALLTEPKGSGFYTVGDEIAPGIWRSTGSGDGCYWARLNSSQGILDNHFGSAGGTVTIRASDFEVEFSDCGTWEYQG